MECVHVCYHDAGTIDDEQMLKQFGQPIQPIYEHIETLIDSVNRQTAQAKCHGAQIELSLSHPPIHHLSLVYYTLITTDDLLLV